MKPKLLTAIILFVSGYSPLLIILAVKNFNFELYKFNNPNISIGMILICIVSVIMLFVSISKIDRGNMAIKIKSVKSRSLDIINYTIPYLFCAFDIDLSKPEDIITILLFLLILLILTISSQSIFLNPILALRGYSFYDVDYKYDGKLKSNVIISAIELDNNELYYVRSLTRFLYIVTEMKDI